MGAPVEVKRMIERFPEEKHSLNETQVRQSFIDPFFELLGWDVASKRWSQQAFREVVLEDSIRVEGAEKAPDYGFYLGGSRRFFVEAKAPHVSIDTHAKSAFQLRRYGWSAKLPVSILTDFEEFAIYDCRVKPEEGDKATRARIKYLRYDQYDEQWDEIRELFSKEAVWSGSLEVFAPDTKRKGTDPVDKAFLREIEGWRETLAKDVHRLNPSLDRYELNYAVQATIDRIVFLRVCEDRGVEEYGRLESLLENSDIYSRLCDLFRDADDRYNSGLFHFRREPGRGNFEDWTLGLGIEDEVLQEVIGGLYYPKSPYQFSVMPVEILGQTYEQFLGKVIRLEDGDSGGSSGNEVIVEEKPEVRKAGGVYYTPTYIVDYIVEKTVGRLVEGKTPRQVSKLKIVDPACGSGSFLIGAYDYLLNWHLRWYVEDGPEKHAKAVFEHEYRTDEGTATEWRLTVGRKREILLNNIYGVDIDSQAVEVTKLSLLLKVLEGETGETVNNQPSFFRERALPDLDENIKCGNSLIGHDFYDNEQMVLLDDDEQRRVNTFDWQEAFEKKFRGKKVEFDAVIGNPPYVFTRNQGITELQKVYFYGRYEHQSSQLNTFGVFVERCYALLRNSGVLGFITPNNWLTIDSFAPLRRFVLEKTADVRIANILDRVFTAADVDTAVIVLGKGKPTHLTIGEIAQREEVFARQVELSAIKPSTYIIQISLLKDAGSRQLIERIESCARPLSAFCTVSTGLKAYQTGKGKPPQTNHEKEKRVFHATAERDNTYGRYLKGVDVRRYLLAWSGEYLSYGDWLAEPRKSVPFAEERLLIRQIPSMPPYLVHAAFTDEPFYNDINSMIVFAPVDRISLKYILGLINSKLLSVWFQKAFDKLQRKIFPQFKVKELAGFPVRPIDLSDPDDAAKHKKTVGLVDQMLSLHEQLSKAKIPADRSRIQGQITSTDKKIDQLVYELYGLTDDEIEIVEGS